MKKILLIAAFAGLFTLGYCQDVKVNINNHEATTKEECPYRINGICSSEDIGGVDVQIEYSEETTWAVFTNYNNSPVTVLYEIKNRCEKLDDVYNPFYTSNGTVGTIVLGEKQSKKIKLDQSQEYSYTVNRYIDRNRSECYSIKGMIVRRLSN